MPNNASDFLARQWAAAQRAEEAVRAAKLRTIEFVDGSHYEGDVTYPGTSKSGPMLVASRPGAPLKDVLERGRCASGSGELYAANKTVVYQGSWNNARMSGHGELHGVELSSIWTG
jgi:hypothetical protein